MQHDATQHKSEDNLTLDTTAVVRVIQGATFMKHNAFQISVMYLIK